MSIYVLVAVVSLHAHASSVTVFNGLNFPEWKEQVNFHLGVLDLNLALLEVKHADLTKVSTDEEKLYRKAWTRSNRLSLMFMRMTIVNNIKTAIDSTESAKKIS